MEETNNKGFYSHEFLVLDVSRELDKENKEKRVLLKLNKGDSFTTLLLNASKPILVDYEAKIRK